MYRPGTAIRSVPARCSLLLSIAIAAVPCMAGAQDDAKRTVRVVAEACAPGVTPASRDAALNAAHEAAVRLWIESTLGQPATDDFQPLMEYVDTYTASSRLAGVRLEENRTCVEAEVYLYERVLRTDLATVLFKLRGAPPSVAFLFIENDEVANARRFQEQTAMAAPLMEAFRAKGFRLIEPADARRMYGERELLAALETGPMALARFAADLNAEAVVCVESRLTAWDQQDGARAVRNRAELKLLVVSASDGATLENFTAAAEVTAADAPTGLRYAIDDALYKIRDLAAVAAVLASRGTMPDRFDLSIDGVRDFAAADGIARSLRRLDGVSGADVLTVRDGVARLRFVYSGRIAAVVEFLESGGAGQPMRAVKVVDKDMQFRLGG